MRIYTFLESKNEHDELLEYKYPTKEGLFLGTLISAHWAPGAILHTFWDMENGDKLDCCLFRDNHCKYICDIEKLSEGTVAKLKLVKSQTGKIWLRKVEICQNKRKKIQL